MAEGVPVSRTRTIWEIVIVLSLSYGAAGVFAVVSIIERLTRDQPLSQQTAQLNRPAAQQAILDLTLQLLNFAFGLAPVALVVFLVWRHTAPHLGALGLGRAKSDFAGLPGGLAAITGQPRRLWPLEALQGLGLAALIGIPGLAFYLVTKAIGINVTIETTSLAAHWWTIPVLVLMALKAALGEEIIVVAYLFTRLRSLGVSVTVIIISSALLRGSYHLYQGFGGFIGNVVMGLVFGWVYHRYGRVLPLIIAHWVLDIVSFVGYPLAVALWPTQFGLAS
ncbi:CPBP family intramembrane glutamic endopeptidase [Leucobacter exalbidus]|nr:type II CAAX endopeptidase family protein [Leucobacter exalbidus]